MTAKPVKKTKDERPIMKDVNNLNNGTFSNIMNISTTGREVFLDFGISVNIKVGAKISNDVNLVSRVILTREHAVEIKEALDRILSTSLDA